MLCGTCDSWKRREGMKGGRHLLNIQESEIPDLF